MAVAEHADGASVPELGQVDGLVEGALYPEPDGSDTVTSKVG